MLERVTAANNVVFYRSPLLHAASVPHAFSTRVGGVSVSPFDSLNLGNPSGVPEQDSAENIAENYRRLHTAIGGENRRRMFAHQIHGSVVLNPATSPQTDSIHGGCEIGKGDALFTNDASVLLSVRTADCVPVLLASGDGQQVAACHAGWRGVIAGVVPEALKLFDHPANVLAAIGPAISYDAFEVGPEVADEFERAFPHAHLIRRLPDGKSRVNLQHALELQLQAAGVMQIDLTDRCTVTHADEFFSHRRDRGVSGRMASVIGVRS
jgi:YfiH family protein